MRIAAVQYDIAWEDKPANHARVEQLLSEKSLTPETYVVLPEMGDTGFSFNLDAIVDDQSLPWAEKFARENKIWLQAGYAVRTETGMGRNCCTIINPQGKSVGTYQKIHPFSYGKEAEFFTGGDRLLLRTCSETVVCPLICYDLRFPELFRIAAKAGAEVFTIGANWPNPRLHQWRAMLIARAIENQAYVVGVNRVGSDPKLSYSGGSIIVSPQGEILAEADDQTAILEAELDLEALRQWRADFPALKDIRGDALGTIAVDEG